MCRVDVDPGHSSSLIKFLVKHDLLATSHQNQAATSGTFPGMPDSWVAWSKDGSNNWKDIVRVYQARASNPEAETASIGMPPDLVEFIRQCISLPLPRIPFFKPDEGAAPDHVTRVNPKKIHEVFTMSSYVSSLFNQAGDKPRMVDIGAGQGYLSRALSSSPHNFHVLALDSNENQTTGSISRKDWLPQELSDSGESGRITHMTTHIGDTPSLSSVIEEWCRSPSIQNHDSYPVPIVLIGLHCCGDLTPSVLRFVRHSLNNPRSLYEVIGCVIVGCCYNMCEPTTFPTSQRVASEIGLHGPLNLQTQHLHLATQSPLIWVLPTSQTPQQGPYVPTDHSLSIKKVTYRALLSRRLPVTHRPEREKPLSKAELLDVDWRANRVGRLGNGAYKDFGTFLKAARGKLGLEDGAMEECNREEELSKEEDELGRTLEVYYVLRCLLGPVIESLVALDRYAFLQETRASAIPPDSNKVESNGKIELINLFDQFTGSLRNLALVWTKHPDVE